LGRDADLSKLQLRAATHFRDAEGGDRVIVRPPSGRAPCLLDFLAWLKRQWRSSRTRRGGAIKPRRR
jgi:hypothetical protein